MGKWSKRRGEADGFWIAIVFAIIVGVVCYAAGRCHGHEQGVRDGIEGRYVIDTLSDGTTKVVKKKGASDAN